jgi:hypothetical protein
MLEILSKETEKNTLMGWCEIVVHSFKLTTDPDRREHFTECDGTLAVHVLYVTCGWKSRSSR